MKTVFQIFPPLLLALILFVQLAAMCMKLPLYDFREILIWLCWTPFVMLPYYFFKKRYLYSIAVVLVFLVGLITLIHWILLKGPLTTSSIFIFLNTNLNEATEFLSVKFTFRFLWLLPYFVLFGFALLYPPRTENKTVYGKYIVLFLCLSSVIFFAEYFNGFAGYGKM